MKLASMLLVWSSLLSTSAALADSAPILNSKTVQSTAGQADWCLVKTWPFGRNITIQQFSAHAIRMPRMTLLQIGWGEILLNRPDHLVAPIFQYLGAMENSEMMRGYYKAMAYVAQNEVSAELALTKWPKRVPLANEHYALSEMCDFYQKAKDMATHR